MKTYKEKFLAACEQIASEYDSENGHWRSMEKCPMCSIYNYNCSVCGINYTKKYFDCISQNTAKSAVLLKNYNVKSPLRAKFYRTLVERVKSLSPEEFTPSAISNPNSELLRIVREVDTEI